MKNKGLFVLEALLAMFFVSIAFFPFFYSLKTNLKASVDAKKQYVATQYAQELMEEVKQKDFDNLSSKLDGQWSSIGPDFGEVNYSTYIDYSNDEGDSNNNGKYKTWGGEWVKSWRKHWRDSKHEWRENYSHTQGKPWWANFISNWLNAIFGGSNGDDDNSNKKWWKKWFKGNSSSDSVSSNSGRYNSWNDIDDYDGYNEQGRGIVTLDSDDTVTDPGYYRTVSVRYVDDATLRTTTERTNTKEVLVECYDASTDEILATIRWYSKKSD